MGHPVYPYIHILSIYRFKWWLSFGNLPSHCSEFPRVFNSRSVPSMRMWIFNSNCSATSNFRPSFSSIPWFTRHTKFTVSTISHLSPLTLLVNLSGILISFIHCSGSRYLNHNSSTMLLQLKVFRLPVSTRQRRTHQTSSMDDSPSKKRSNLLARTNLMKFFLVSY